MKNVPDTKMGRMYREHIELIMKKDIDKLLDQYADDALLISSFMKEPKYYKGRAQLRELMQGILGIEGLETEIVFWGESEDPQTLMVTEKISLTTPDGTANMRFADSWYLENGKIKVHFAGMVQYPDGSLA
jgi:ketosteroid isomerase-like protein